MATVGIDYEPALANPLTRTIERLGCIAVPDPFPPEACAAVIELFKSVVDTRDPTELEASTRRIDQLYGQAFSGYHRTLPDSKTGTPGKDSFGIRSFTPSGDVWRDLMGSKATVDPLRDLYWQSHELMLCAQPLAQTVLYLLDVEHPGAGIQERHVWASEHGTFFSDDLRILLYDETPLDTELSEPHTDRSSLSFVRQKGGFFVERGGKKISIDVPEEKLVCFPGQRLTHPDCCPEAKLPPTVHGAISTGSGRRAVITYQVQPLFAAGMP